jgi:tRNA (uracil-5-)-methyltransferase
MPLSRVIPAQYQPLLADKVSTVRELLSPYSPPSPDVFASQPTGFRLRAEFRMWHDGDDLNYVMYRKEDPKTPVTIDHFPIASVSIQSLMPRLLVEIKSHQGLRYKLFQVEFLATLAGELLVTLIYHRKLDETWEERARELIAILGKDFPGLSLIGRSRKQKIVLAEDFVREVLCVHDKRYGYRQYEQSFTQPNALVNIQMLEWACERASACSGDLLELYCGNGNFTLPLAQHFDNVIATELAKSSVRAARENLLENNITNVQVVRLSAEEVTQAMNAERIFRRLSDLPQPLDEYDLQTVFVDPPRAGLDAYTLGMVSQFPNILYVSCNPTTLAENLESLSKTHRIEHFALFDQFPYTEHMECGLLLQRNVKWWMCV